MDEIKRRIPKRRFKEFQNAEAWEQRELSKEVDIIMGQSPDGNTYSDTPSDYILVQGNADLKDGWVFPRIWTTQVTKKADAGDLIMSVRAPAGEMGKTAYNVVLGRGVAAIKGNEFIFQNLVKMNDDGYWKKLSSGSTFDSLNSDNIRNAELSVPSTEEQEIIGEFFKKIDNLITLHQRKLEKIKSMKKAYLYEIFPAEGENRPKRRFKGFTEAWEQCKLGEFCEMFNGDRGINYPNDKDMVSVGIPFINAGDIKNGRVDLRSSNKITREKYNQLGGAKLQLGDIVYCLRGTLGKNAFIDNFEEGTVASSLVALRPKNIDGKYLFHILNSDIELRQRTVNDEGAAQPNLSAKNLSEFNIPVPKFEEQTKISSYLDRLDNLITLHQCKLEKLNNLKKAYLNEMFV